MRGGRCGTVPGVISSLIGIAVGLVLGFVIAAIVSRGWIEDARNKAISEGKIEIARLDERASSVVALQNQVAALNERLYNEIPQEKKKLVDEATDIKTKFAATDSLSENRRQENERLNAELLTARLKLEQSGTKLGEMQAELGRLSATLDAERAQNPDKLQLLEEAKKTFTYEFESLANRFLEDKSKRFTEQNQVNIDRLLSPVASKLQEFKNKVEEVYDKEGRDRTALALQVTNLLKLNQQLSQDAHDLTRALKGSGKTQGNWGELILERVLEASGLRKGEEYELRETFTAEGGRRSQPDVVIHLPEDKNIVVDAKVSLTAYTEYSSADDESARELALREHLDSVRRHVKGLSEKNYQELYELKSLDFVIMFVPIEPAFMLAISHDNNLCENAWQKNVLLVSPSTFLFVVRTVAYLWRQEQAKRSVQEIAKRGGELYDKFVGFVEDLAGVGTRLRQASESYETARNKLARGRGNLIRQAEMLKELGVRATKSLPEDLVETALTEQSSVLPTLVASTDDLGFSDEMPAEEPLVDLEEDIPF